MKISDLDSYKYIMFVDASGDDGYKFGEKSSDGSSFSFVVSCFVTAPKDFVHNKSVLEKMKSAMLVKPEQEIKSTALGRSRYADRVYSEMKYLKGFAYSVISDKKMIQECKPTPNDSFYQLTVMAREDLSGITHFYPCTFIQDNGYITASDRILIVIDNMKKREMDSIKNRLAYEYPIDNYDIIFRDSKDKDFPLIQIADIIAGTIRKYYENCLPLSNHNRYCKLCIHTTHKDKHKTLKYMCQNKKTKSLFYPYIHNESFNTVMKFHKVPNAVTSMGNSFIILPVSQMAYFTYISCLILNEIIKRS